MAYEQITQFSQCVSQAEKSQRTMLTIVNALAWIGIVIAVVASMGAMLLFFAWAWFMSWLVSGYQVRVIQALGATVSPTQLPEVYKAASDVCQRFGIQEMPKIIVVPSGEMNALAIKFARKKVVVILSEMLASVIDHPERLRFLLAHELCHHALDHGSRGTFEIYKPAKYRQARELTCDNAGLVAAGDLLEGRTVIKMLCAGRHLHMKLDEQALIAESHEIYSGLTGWFVRSYLSHPPAGSRIENLNDFHAVNAGAAATAGMPMIAAG